MLVIRQFHVLPIMMNILVFLNHSARIGLKVMKKMGYEGKGLEVNG